MPDRLPREPLTTNRAWLDRFMFVYIAVLLAATVIVLVVKVVA